MWKSLLILALCGSVWAQVPAHFCTAASTTSISCNIPSTSAHHLVTIWAFTQGDTTAITYSDTLGNSYSQNPFLGCLPGGNVCNAGVAMAQSYSISFAAQSAALFYISTGASSGSVTFTVGGFAGNPISIYVAEYGQDLVAIDSGEQTNPTITTTGANDLIVVMTGDSGVTTCGSITPASGFTMESSQLATCKSYTDRINVPPGAYSYRPTLTGSGAPGFSAVAFGVAPFVSANVRHARNVY